MLHITIQQAADLLEVMTIEHSVESAATITHHGHIEGQPTILIATSRGAGHCYFLQ